MPTHPMNINQALRSLEMTLDHNPLVHNLQTTTVRVPSDPLLWAAAGALIGSLVCRALDFKRMAWVLGLSAPVCLALVAYREVRANRGLVRDPEAGMEH
jgi:hypothetical protein